jgi:hypothetical protein
MNGRKTMTRFTTLGLLLATGLVTPLASLADDHVEARIAQARSAAPDAISAEATIMDSDGTVLVEGSNGWTCLPDTFAGDNAPMCNDEVWMKMLAAFAGKADFEADRIGISYMLQGEPPGSGVSNSDPYHPDRQNAHDYVETGPHLMIVVPKALLEGITDDPSGGGPYVMWGDTPYAHVMVPITDRED